MPISSRLAQTKHNMTTQLDQNNFWKGGLLEKEILQKWGLFDLEHGSMDYSETKYD